MEAFLISPLRGMFMLGRMKPGTLVVDLPRDLLSPPRSDQMLCWGRLNPFPQGRSLL